MSDHEQIFEVVHGDGYAVGHIDAMGEAYGFRKIRKALGVDAFGINALVLPPGYDAPAHSHERQEETYFVHRGTVEVEFGDGSRHVLGPGGAARVDATTVRQLHNVGSEDAVLVIAGGSGGYVGRDGVAAEPGGGAAAEGAERRDGVAAEGDERAGGPPDPPRS